MQQVNVRFHSMDQIRQFISTIEKLDDNFDLGSGHRVVDAKSILGVLALDLSGPLRLRYHSDDLGIREKIAYNDVPKAFQGMICLKKLSFWMWMER